MKIPEIGNLIPIVILSLFGGLVRLLNSKDHISLRMFIAGIFTSIFAGFIIYAILIEFGIPDGYIVAAVSLSGYTSRDIIHLLSEKFLKKINDTSNNF